MYTALHNKLATFTVYYIEERKEALPLINKKKTKLQTVQYSRYTYYTIILIRC